VLCVVPALTLMNSTFCLYLRISRDSLNKEILFQPIIFALVIQCVFCEIYCTSSYARAIYLSSSCIDISFVLLNSFISYASPIVTNFRISTVYHLFIFLPYFFQICGFGLCCNAMFFYLTIQSESSYYTKLN